MATIYVGPGETYTTIKAGIAAMSGGDTLIIRDGTYTGANNMLAGDGGSYDISAKVGTESNPTIIKAETDWGVVIDGESSRVTGWLESGDWIILRGLHLRNSTGYGMRINGASYNRVIRCCNEESVSFSFAFTGMDNSLMEECFAWGLGTYFFDDNNYWGSNNRNIFRKCFVRKDAHYGTSGGNNYASFATYYSPTNAVYFQNCISVDSEYHQGGPIEEIWNMSVIYTANGTSGINADGCIGINEQGQAFLGESSSSGSIKNGAFNSTTSTNWSDGMLTYGSMTVENNLIWDNYGGSYKVGVWEVNGIITSLKNNIVYKHNTGLESISGSHSYNCLYNNTNYSNTTQGTGDQIYNPTSNGLLYPTRIEIGSNLAQDGEAGARIGPQILYQIGRQSTSETNVGGTIGNLSGLLYNQTGWSELQDGQGGRALLKLWPFPNEATIKSKMSAYSAHGATGARGFCTGNSLDGSSQTLTKYIWEYLGNQIPNDIYGFQRTLFRPYNISRIQNVRKIHPKY